MIAATLRSALALIIFSGNLVFSAATPAAPSSPTAAPWAAQCSDPSPGTPTDSYTNCTISPQWWTSYSSCPITPVHTERYTGKVYPNEQALYEIPWLKLASPSGTAIAHLFSGNRPLPVNATFSDGSMAKVLWQTTPRVLNFHMTATSLSESAEPPAPITDFNSAGVDWASYVNIPKPGCWRVDVGGTTEAGDQITWSAVFIVVE